MSSVLTIVYGVENAHLFSSHYGWALNVAGARKVFDGHMVGFLYNGKPAKVIFKTNQVVHLNGIKVAGTGNKSGSWLPYVGENGRKAKSGRSAQWQQPMANIVALESKDAAKPSQLEIVNAVVIQGIKDMLPASMKMDKYVAADLQRDLGIMVSFGRGKLYSSRVKVPTSRRAVNEGVFYQSTLKALDDGEKFCTSLPVDGVFGNAAFELKGVYVNSGRVTSQVELCNFIIADEPPSCEEDFVQQAQVSNDLVMDANELDFEDANGGIAVTRDLKKAASFVAMVRQQGETSVSSTKNEEGDNIFLASGKQQQRKRKAATTSVGKKKTFAIDMSPTIEAKGTDGTIVSKVPMNEMIRTEHDETDTDD